MTAPMGRANLPVIAAAQYEAGRVVVVGHEGFFGDTPLANADNVALSVNIAASVL